MDTLSLLKNCMLAQAQYLIYNNLQTKTLHEIMEDKNKETGLQNASLTYCISTLFQEAWLQGSRHPLIETFKTFKQDSRDFTQLLEIYYNHKRFLIVSLQTLASYHHEKGNMIQSLCVANEVCKMPEALKNDDNYNTVHVEKQKQMKSPELIKKEEKRFE